MVSATAAATDGRDLRPAGTVEVCGTERERRECGPHPGDVEIHPSILPDAGPARRVAIRSRSDRRDAANLSAE